MTPTIQIILQNNTWHADMTHATGAEEIKELFGTYLLPTPFTAKSATETVVASLRKRNPGHEILVPF